MIAFGPGTKRANGWYVRLYPNPGFAIARADGRRHVVRLNTPPGHRRIETLHPKGESPKGGK